MNITTKKYNSSNPCVTFDDLVAYHYLTESYICNVNVDDTKPLFNK